MIFLPVMPQPAMVAAPVNSGVGIINFSGDGGETKWGQTGFSNSRYK